MSESLTGPSGICWQACKRLTCLLQDLWQMWPMMVTETMRSETSSEELAISRINNGLAAWRDDDDYDDDDDLHWITLLWTSENH